MKKTCATFFWLLLALAGAAAYATLAFRRGEPVNSAYLLIAALCTYAIGYRFYSKWIAARVLMLDDRRATPCEVHDDGRDFVKTNKWIVFGHHFAAIAGPGPLVGPVLAAQFGYLPGTLWILIGVVLGGAVQDFVILFCSMRRDGKSLGQMVKEELNAPAGFIALLAILAIMVILLAVLALVVVKALAESPWGVFTVGATIPIALFMGGYLRFCARGQGAGSVGHRRRAAAAGGVGRQTGLRKPALVAGLRSARHHARLGHHRLRPRCQQPAGVAAARAARLPQHVHEARHDLRAGARHSARAARSADARAHPVRRRLRPGRRRQGVSLLLHHHRLRRDLRFSHAHRQRHHAEDHHARRLRAVHRLRRDVPANRWWPSWRSSPPARSTRASISA